MHYKVHDSKRGKVFGTLDQASAYRNYLIKSKGIVVCITETKAKVTHKYILGE